MMNRPRGRRHGAMMTAWLFFATLFDPKRIAAIEHVETQKRIGSDAARISRAAAAPPVAPRGH